MSNSHSNDNAMRRKGNEKKANGLFVICCCVFVQRRHNAASVRNLCVIRRCTHRLLNLLILSVVETWHAASVQNLCDL